jgi:pimeloyl-ACP methyl ester carboxylesterase
MKLNIFIKLSLLLVFVAVVGWVAALKFPEKTIEIATWAERARNGLSWKTLELDGQQWFYLEGGNLDGETILMLHGFAADKDSWTRFSGFLGEYHLIAVDLPGFGESTQLYDTSYTMAAQRERIYDFAEAQGLERFHLLGSSMGGQLAALYADKYPEPVISLGMISNGGVTSPKPSEMQIALAQGKPIPLIVEAEDDFIPMLDFVTYKRPWIPLLYTRHLAHEAWLNSSFHREIWNQLRGDKSAELESVLTRIERPTWVLWGREDRVLDISTIEVMGPLLGNESIVIMDKTGHLPMLERPQQAAKLYLEFLDSHATKQ